MAYSRVNKCLDEGRTWVEARETFKISMTAINSWRKKYKETGEVKDDPPRRRAHKKLDPVKLRAYVEEHFDAYLQERADAFGCVESAVRKACKRLEIARKKEHALPGTKSRASRGISA